MLFLYISPPALDSTVFQKLHKMEVAKAKQQKHFVLVHGGCHGAWCWYKLKPLLEAAGHRVTAIDLSAAGVDTKKLDEIHTLSEYTKPLIDLIAAIPPEKKVILVGHSYGGINMALAMDHYPEKISVAVYLSALMPDTIHAPSYVLDKYFEHIPEGHLLDTKFLSYGTQEESRQALLLGPEYLSSKLYQKCTREDLELAKMLVRPMSLYVEKLSKAKPFSAEGYGSVKRVYVIVNEDKALPADFQRWQVKSIGVTEVKEINDADHMAMLSLPQGICECLLEVADKYN